MSFLGGDSVSSSISDPKVEPRTPERSGIGKVAKDVSPLLCSEATRSVDEYWSSLVFIRWEDVKGVSSRSSSESSLSIVADCLRFLVFFCFGVYKWERERHQEETNYNL
jgi:hypothetical protein